jgi:hypothetical protein
MQTRNNFVHVGNQFDTKVSPCQKRGNTKDWVNGIRAGGYFGVSGSWFLASPWRRGDIPGSWFQVQSQKFKVKRGEFKFAFWSWGPFQLQF